MTTRRQMLRRAPRSRRKGAILTMELMLVFPLLTIIVFAAIELSMLWMAQHHLSSAARTGCRVATIAGTNFRDVERAVERALVQESLIHCHRIELRRGRYSGDPVCVEIYAPMTAAAPDMLRIFGFSLKGRRLVARAVMRRE